MKPRYPTPQQIMRKPIKFKPQTIQLTKDWKHHFFTEQWKHLSSTEQFTHIAQLVHALAKVVYRKPLSCVITNTAFACYNHITKTIHLGPVPSIISALHELAHHLFGDNELVACRFSIHLFKKCFPKQFNTLEWQGHLLVKKHRG